MIEDRKDFYANELDLARAENTLQSLAARCTFKEILWMVRNITYDMVSYYDEESKGIIYTKEYSEANKSQACRLQRQLSAICDLYGQSIIDKREFDKDYLRKYDFKGE